MLLKGKIWTFVDPTLAVVHEVQKKMIKIWGLQLMPMVRAALW